MKIKRILSYALDVILIIIVACVLSLAISAKSSKGDGKIFGVEIMSVLSGSMSPTFDTGSLVIIHPSNLSDIKQGDIITFRDTDGRTVTHRAVEIKENKITTKGDANNDKDSSPVTSDRLIGKVSTWIPYAGYVVHFARSKTGIALFLIVPGIYLVVSQIWVLYKAFNEQIEAAKNTENTQN